MSAPPTAAPEATAPPAAWPAALHARESHTVTAERDRYVRERLNFQVFTLGLATQAVALVAAILLWGAFYWVTRDGRVLGWAAMVHCAQALRYAGFAGTARRYPASRYPDALPSEAIRHVLPLLLMTSCAWGAAPWLLTPANGAHDAQLPVLAIFLFGMIAGSIPAIMPMPALVGVWLGPLALSLAARFAWLGSAQGWVTAIGALLFAVTMARFAIAQRRLLVAELRGQLEREELTAQLVTRTRELQRLNQERSRFFASASHDLRQPVHALALFSRSLLRDLQGHAAQPVAQRVVQSTDAVSGLLNAMLDISRIDAGTVVPRPTDVAVDEVFMRVAQLFEPRAQEAGLALRFHTPPAVMRVDGELLLRILANFVDNAIKYTPRGGVLVAARPRGDWMRLAVWDTGIGIADDQIAHVFDEFYQAHNPQRDVARGLGIGLSIVRRLAHLLGGEVAVRSRHGRGTVFWLDVPCRAAAQPQAPLPELATSASPADAAVPAAPISAPRVLVLDDEAQVGEAVRLWLAPHCARVQVTTTTEQACTHVASEPGGFDALVVDYRLSGALNGIEAAAQLWQLAGRALPTILVTGDTDPARVRAAYDSGLTVMCKPVQPEALLQTLHALIRADVARPA